MSTPFFQTLRALDADDPRQGRWGMAVVVGVLGLWAAWLVFARVSLTVVSPEARVVAAGEPRPLQAPVSGRVRAVEAALGERVAAGQVLLELDARRAEAALQEARAMRDGLQAQVGVAELILEAAETALGASPEAVAAVRAEAQARLVEARTAADQAARELARIEPLAARDVVPEHELTQARSALARAAALADAAQEAARLAASEGGQEGAARRGEVERHRQALVDLKARAAAAEAVVQGLEAERERYTLRAPVAGVVGELGVLQAGAVVAAGDSLGTVIPDGELELVAALDPGTALGRVRPGQSAQLRLAAFPWSTWGTVPATVRAVASEPREGRLRVELELHGDRTEVPLEHGLEGQLEIEVEELAPGALLLRAAGQALVETRGSP